MSLFRLCSVVLAAALLLPAAASAQDESLRVEAPHPRLLLTARRLKLLRRERERQSMRWNQFNLLMAGKAPMPEPGFAEALYDQVAGNADAGRHAVAWALGTATDLRQLALVFDWCQDALTEAQSRALAAKLAHGIEQSTRDTSLPAVRSRLFAAIALAGHLPDVSDRELNAIVNQWWIKQLAPALEAGRTPLPFADGYALQEMLHVVRDNLGLDLRDNAPAFFHDAADMALLGCYPATFSAPENEYRIPVTPHPNADPDLRQAALARAAELSMVAYDANAMGSQILQGWLMNDNFLLRGTFGAPYEFLWANPYQPGLSYYRAPLVLHDELFGRLFARSNWEESAEWLGYFEGQLQLFQNGRATVLDPKQAAGPIVLTSAVVLPGSRQRKFAVKLEAAEPVFIVGLKPRQRYAIEVDDEELDEALTDPGGILALQLPPGKQTGVRLRELTD